MRRKKKTIREKMFETYVLALLVVAIAFIVFYLTQTYQMMRSQITDSMSQLSANTAERIDDKFRQISALSERIVFSSDVRHLFFEELPQSGNAVETYRLANELSETLYGITGAKLEFYHMNLNDREGNLFNFGQEYNYISSQEKNPWIEEALKKEGKAVFSAMHESSLENATRHVISLYRGFGANIGGRVDGTVEIQVEADTLKNLIDDMVYTDEGPEKECKVIIFDKEGELIYPVTTDEETQKDIKRLYGSAAEKETAGLHSDNIINSGQITGGKEYIFLSRCEVPGWTLLLAVPDSTLKEPVFHVMIQLLVIGLLMIFGISIFSNRAAKTYADPIYRLYDSVKNLTLDDLSGEYQIQMQSDVDELEQLNKVFNKMVLRLHESLEETVRSRNMEMHSRMLALQAQMNPHFLYNTLTVISIMAENDEKENVQWACRNLSNMLSYISSDSLNLVTVKDELKHTKSYLSLIKMRYMEDIQIDIDVPDEMESVKIPKLVIQPLVENPVKYTVNTRPVWRIRLEGRLESNRWFVRVSDNGNGFSKETLNSIYKKIEEIRSSGIIPELSLKGMGILNIYLRMNFYYKDQFVFKIDNLPDGGAMIVIGGMIDPDSVLST